MKKYNSLSGEYLYNPKTEIYLLYYKVNNTQWVLHKEFCDRQSGYNWFYDYADTHDIINVSLKFY